MDKVRELFESKYTVPTGAEFMDSGNHYIGGLSVTGLTLINIQWSAFCDAYDAAFTAGFRAASGEVEQ